RQEQIAEPDHTIEGRAELVRYVREELVLEFARLVELGVEAGQLPVLVLELGVLRLKSLRGVAHLHRQAARMLVRRLALTSNGQVRRGVLERDARVGGELASHGCDEQAHEPTLGAQRGERQPPGGIDVRRGELQLRPYGPRGGASIV